MAPTEEEMRIRFAIAEAWSNAYASTLRAGKSSYLDAERNGDKAARNVSELLRGSKKP